MSPLQATFTLTGLWTLSWIAAAFWADRAERRPARGAEWVYRLLTFVGAWLVFRPAFPHPREAYRLWTFGPSVDWAFFFVAVLGFAFAWWARLYLGRLWSSSVTLKAAHRVVDTGPYAIVRHPIYTGLLLAFAATVAEEGTAPALAGTLVLVLAFWIKARLEERFLSVQLGAEAYDGYRRRVPMLVPFGPCG